MDNDFFKWFLICVRHKYADFSGRARRKEYWMFLLVYFLLLVTLGLIKPLLAVLLALALVIPATAVAVRRLHDIGKSGWWIFIALIPILGELYFFYLMTKDGRPEANRWGENPKTLSAG